METSEKERDKLARVVLAHEFYRCNESFDHFVIFSQFKRLYPEKKEYALKVYNSYTDFAAHLYEFIVGCIKLDSRRLSENSKKDFLYTIYSTSRCH